MIADPVGACLLIILVAHNIFYARKSLSVCTEICLEHIASLNSVLGHEAVPLVTKGDIFFDIYIITSVNYNTTLVGRSHKILANSGTRDIVTKVKVNGLVIFMGTKRELGNKTAITLQHNHTKVALT